MSEAAKTEEDFKGVRGAWYVVILLAMANGVSFMDRGFVALVIDPIKQTLHVTDTQIGLMIGPAFIIFYSTVSLPIAQLADAHNRKRIILAGMFFWSACTALFGLARNFATLGVARMGIGLGEAALVPAGVSIIGDMVPRAKIGRAVSMFTAGGILGGSLSSILGGFLMLWLTKIGVIHIPVFGDLHPWQSAFVIISLPGIVLGFVIMLTMREPMRRARATAANKPKTSRQTARYLWTNKRAVLSLILGFAFISGVSSGGGWTPTFFMRTYNLSPATVGTAIGSMALTLGVFGAVLGGWTADLLRKRGREDANILVAVAAMLLMLPMSVTIFMTNYVWIAFSLMAGKVLLTSMAFGVAHSCVSLAVPTTMRSQAVAVYLLCANFFGIGFVPLLIPVMTDYVFRDPLSLRYSLAMVSVVGTPISVGLLLIARRPFLSHLRDLAAPAPSPAAA
ncbi:spinster family MFS transporter [Phenylobacterium immobile]|uniref:spinster family MFS transporter n=1 Tax=Phenylobacterium immobile TaxID=21 RepID=UPI000A4A8550|nr:MFS transporter [Phenylobacterium immobile]